MPNFIKVAGKGDIGPGEGRTVDVNGTAVAIFNINGEFFAINNSCPHRGGSLGDGFLEGNVVTCPLHGWQFDVKTGQSPLMPAKVSCYQVKVEGNDVLVALD